MKASWLAVWAILLIACGGTANVPTVAPTLQTFATKSAQLEPTATSEPTFVSTIHPTNTRLPTATMPPTNTPAPTEKPSLTPSFDKPNFINHTAPTYALDWSVFEQVPCAVDANGKRTCDPKEVFGALGCDEIQKPSDFLAALKPEYPIALCFVEPYRNSNPQEPEEGTFLYRTGGLRGMYARLLIRANDQFQVLYSLDELARVYAPIEAPDEALAYVLAATPFEALYGLKYESEYKYLTDVVEDTFAKPNGDGYLVRVFHFQFFGCGPHGLTAIEFHVTRDGAIEERTRQPIYTDPKMDGLCID